MDKNHVIAVVPAAGIGSRMQASVPKQYMRLFAGGPCIIEATVRLLLNSGLFDAVFVAVSKDDGWIQQMDLAKAQILRTGGQSRAHTVLQTLEAIAPQYGKNDLVLVHDAARPFVDESILERAYVAVSECKACVVGMPSKDTVTIVEPDGYAKETPNRNYVWIVQTPQVFDVSLIKEAHSKLEAIEKIMTISVTDDAMVVEHMLGVRVRLVEGSYENIKITTPDDLLVANSFLKKD